MLWVMSRLFSLARQPSLNRWTQYPQQAKWHWNRSSLRRSAQKKCSSRRGPQDSAQPCCWKKMFLSQPRNHEIDVFPTKTVIYNSLNWNCNALWWSKSTTKIKDMTPQHRHTEPNSHVLPKAYQMGKDSKPFETCSNTHGNVHLAKKSLLTIRCQQLCFIASTSISSMSNSVMAAIRTLSWVRFVDSNESAVFFKKPPEVHPSSFTQFNNKNPWKVTETQ